MGNELRVMLEIGPKGKNVIAIARAGREEKGTKVGGRDRDQIGCRTIWSEYDMATNAGIPKPERVIGGDDGLSAYRTTYCAAIREYHAQGKLARKWPLRYLIRHTAFHAMDHTWEMQDKDLTSSQV